MQWCIIDISTSHVSTESSFHEKWKNLSLQIPSFNFIASSLSCFDNDDLFKMLQWRGLLLVGGFLVFYEATSFNVIEVANIQNLKVHVYFCHLNIFFLSLNCIIFLIMHRLLWRLSKQTNYLNMPSVSYNIKLELCCLCVKCGTLFVINCFLSWKC